MLPPSIMSTMQEIPQQSGITQTGLTFKADFDVGDLLKRASLEVPAYDHKSTVLYQLIRQAPTKTEGGVNVLQLVGRTIQASAAIKLPPAVSEMPGKQLIIKAYELFCDEQKSNSNNEDDIPLSISDEERKNLISEWQNASGILTEAIKHIFQQWGVYQQNM